MNISESRDVMEFQSKCCAIPTIFLQIQNPMYFHTHSDLDSALVLKAQVHHLSQSTISSVVTVSKFFLSVGFGRFCRKEPRFSVRFRFS